jgi:hypothetical protein
MMLKKRIKSIEDRLGALEKTRKFWLPSPCAKGAPPSLRTSTISE